MGKRVGGFYGTVKPSSGWMDIFHAQQLRRDPSAPRVASLGVPGGISLWPPLFPRQPILSDFSVLPGHLHPLFWDRVPRVCGLFVGLCC